MKKKRIMLTTTVIVGLTGLTGCQQADRYDVLDRVADTTSIGLNLCEKVAERYDSICELFDDALDDFKTTIKDINEAASAEDKLETSASTASLEDLIAALGDRPEYNAEDYVDTDAVDMESLKLSDYLEEVTDSDVEERIRQSIISQNAYTVKDDKSEVGDVVNVDFDVLDEDGESKLSVSDEYMILENTSNSQLQTNLIGTSKGDELSFYCSYTDDELYDGYAGETVTYNVTVNGIYSIEESDDIAAIISAGGCSTIESLKKEIRENLEYTANVNAYTSMYNDLLSECEIKSYPSEVVEYEVQKGFLEVYANVNATSTADQEFTSYISGLGYNTVEEFSSDLEQTIKNEVAEEMKVLAIAERYNLLPSEKELDEALDDNLSLSKNEMQYRLAKANIEKELKENAEK